MTSILVTGTIAPFHDAQPLVLQPGGFIDPGIFDPAGTDLTGHPFQVLWNSDPAVTASLTIDGITITLGPVTGPLAPYAFMRDDYQNITVSPGIIALDTFSPTLALDDILGLGGAFSLLGPNTVTPSAGFFYTDSMIVVPGPIVGGLIPFIIMCILAKLLLTTLGRYVKIPIWSWLYGHITGSYQGGHYARG